MSDTRPCVGEIYNVREDFLLDLIVFACDVEWEKKMMEDKGGKEFVSDQTFHKRLFLQIVLLCFFSVWDLIVIEGHQHWLPM